MRNFKKGLTYLLLVLAFFFLPFLAFFLRLAILAPFFVSIKTNQQ